MSMAMYGWLLSSESEFNWLFHKECQSPGTFKIMAGESSGKRISACASVSKRLEFNKLIIWISVAILVRYTNNTMDIIIVRGVFYTGLNNVSEDNSTTIFKWLVAIIRSFF
jgi:hypothetical protein